MSRVSDNSLYEWANPNPGFYNQINFGGETLISPSVQLNYDLESDPTYFQLRCLNLSWCDEVTDVGLSVVISSQSSSLETLMSMSIVCILKIFAMLSSYVIVSCFCHSNIHVMSSSHQAI